MSTKQIVSGSLDIAVSTIGNVTQLVAAFAPVPWASPAVNVLIDILKLCQNVETNNEAVVQLGQRCELFLLAAKDDEQQYKSNGTLNALAKSLEETLEQIRTKMQGWKKLGVVKRFILQKTIADDVKNCHVLIDDTITKYSMKGQQEIIKWQAQFEMNSKKDQEHLVVLLTDVLKKQELFEELQRAQHDDIKLLLTMMQDLLGNVQAGTQRSSLQSTLYDVQQQSLQLLPNIDLTHGEVTITGHNAVGERKGFYDLEIWEGDYLGRAKCELRIIRDLQIDPEILTRFKREIEIWRALYAKDHGEYILPLYGLWMDKRPWPYMVSPWMKQGDVVQFFQKHSTIDRRKMIKRIAEAIQVLHTSTPPIAHGDVKGTNIYVNDAGNPLLADFGLSKVRLFEIDVTKFYVLFYSKIVENIEGVPFTKSRGITDAYRWYAPELASGEGKVSTRSDIFSFGMTVLELITGNRPFNEQKSAEALRLIGDGVRPERPTGPVVVARGLDDKMWKLLEECWAQKPEDRPTIQEVLARLL
ncbi:kinase-like protein [Rickenella mellea]|uniref:Kinase-like protein n=1 Tax=Rickenella mellea TaxID=50990 RepID=A0A4Y7QEV0_9AGAM|nr:kinase-like protein [Rickenella mellea]